MAKVNQRFISRNQRSHNSANESSDRLTADQTLSPDQRDLLVRSVIGSQVIEGVSVSRDEAEGWLDELLER